LDSDHVRHLSGCTGRTLDQAQGMARGVVLCACHAHRATPPEAGGACPRLTAFSAGCELRRRSAQANSVAELIVAPDRLPIFEDRILICMYYTVDCDDGGRFLDAKDLGGRLVGRAGPQHFRRTKDVPV